ncbi:hypothetical protein SDC9_56838 [bioreactor metagenome]|uniref:Uncharacterized protein n=1 Tax=bioreactor metagenome TaxID=1076179 RepID=A0A644X308_9ZZZZ
MKKGTIKEIYAVIAFTLALAVFIAVFSSVVTPKRDSYGSTWGSYLKEEKNSIDVMYFGSSITYCDVIPAVIWDNSGLSAYVMAGPEQTIPISYYYIKEATRTQHPKMIFLEVTGVFFKQYQNYTKVNIGYMPWTLNRLAATFNAAERSEWAGLLFPLYNYHSRWDTLEHTDIEIGLFGYGADDLAGYTFLNASTEVNEVKLRGEVLDKENYDRNIGFLQKIAALCKEQDIKLVFYIAPTYWILSDEHTAMLKDSISGIEGVTFIDFNDSIADLKLDCRQDFFDLPHLNYRGAEKFSARLAGMLRTDYNLVPSENTDKALWKMRLEKYDELCNTDSPAK